MKRSFNSENLIVVTALAIAVSLLASACGPGTMKTLKTKTGAGKLVSDKTITEEEKNIIAMQQKRASDVQLGVVSADIVASQEFAKRISYIIYKDLEKKKAGQDDSAVILLLEFSSKSGKNFLVEFLEPQFSADKSTITFLRNSAKQKIDGKYSTAAGELSMDAEVKKSKNGRAVVTIIEKSFDDKKQPSNSEINALVVLRDAKAKVQSKDESILKMNDAVISTRTTQLYISDDNIIQNKKIEQLESRANKIVIDVKNQDGSDLFSVMAPLAKEIKAEMRFNSVADSIKNSFNESIYSIDLNSADQVIKSNLLALTFNNLQSKEVSNATLHLFAKDEDAPSMVATATDEKEKTKTEEAAAEDVKVDAQEATDPQSDTTAKVEAVEPIKTPGPSTSTTASDSQFEMYTQPVEPQAPAAQVAAVATAAATPVATPKAAATKADFSNVKSGFSTVPVKAVTKPVTKVSSKSIAAPKSSATKTGATKSSSAVKKPVTTKRRFELQKPY